MQNPGSLQETRTSSDPDRFKGEAERETRSGSGLDQDSQRWFSSLPPGSSVEERGRWRLRCGGTPVLLLPASSGTPPPWSGWCLQPERVEKTVTPRWDPGGESPTGPLTVRSLRSELLGGVQHVLAQQLGVGGSGGKLLVQLVVDELLDPSAWKSSKERRIIPTPETNRTNSPICY